jgi:hypothetical protein
MIWYVSVNAGSEEIKRMHPLNTNVNRSAALNRRTFLKTLGAAGIAQLAWKASGLASIANGAPISPERAKAPYRVLFNNDTVNNFLCVSSYHKMGEDWRPEMLEGSVDEVAGRVDAHCLSMGHGSVPWYRSKVYPMAAHMRWWQEHFNADPWHDGFGVAPVHRFVADGGDVLQLFIDRCRKTGQAPFVSLRLNDTHYLESADTPGNLTGIHSITRFYVEHPEWRIGRNVSASDRRAVNFDRGLNWAVPEVRERMFSLIAEQCLNYDIDGFEMDFMRTRSFFRLDETTSEQRRAIMREFVGRVRKVLDEGSGGRRRWLSARVPCFVSGFDPLGINLNDWHDVGLDMVNLSDFYCTIHQSNLPRVREMAPDLSVYHEMCHTTWTGPEPVGVYDGFVFRRTTPEEFETGAHWAYSHGAAGVSLFNFVYYREEEKRYFLGDRGPFNEPPFGVLDRLRHPVALAQAPQHWVATPAWHCPWGDQPIKMPQRVTPGKNMSLNLDLSPPEGGWRKDGRMRIQSFSDLRASSWTARLNGEALAETDNRSEPYPNPYPPLLGRPFEIRSWVVPAQLLRAGANEVEIELVQENEALTEKSGYEIPYFDLAMPTSGELCPWVIT